LPRSSLGLAGADGVVADGVAVSSEDKDALLAEGVNRVRAEFLFVRHTCARKTAAGPSWRPAIAEISNSLLHPDLTERSWQCCWRRNSICRMANGGIWQNSHSRPCHRWGLANGKQWGRRGKDSQGSSRVSMSAHIPHRAASSLIVCARDHRSLALAGSAESIGRVGSSHGNNTAAFWE